jgi:hypothetical protein
MKLSNIFKNDLFYIFVISLLVGLIIGVVTSKQIQIALHEIYQKFHPEISKDSKTIIIERATKDLEQIPETSIFETPVKKENSVILFVKKIFVKENNSLPTIDNFSK